jgi:ADP-heptose:LPS heptosyltransferase
MANRSAIGAFRLMRRIDQYLGPPVCLVLGFLRSLAKPLRSPARGNLPTGVRRVLAIKFWGMGSIVLTTPALRALKKAYPACSVTFLTFAQNEGICGTIHSIDHVYAYRAHGFVTFLASFVDLVRFLRREQFDVVIDFEFFANFTSIITAISGARVTVGFHGPKFWRDSFYTKRVSSDDAHITDDFLKAVETLGATADGSHLEELVVADESAAARLDQLLSAHGVTAADPLICVNINASALDHKRRWPLASYRELIQRLLTSLCRYRIVLIGAPDEAPYVAQLTSTLARSPNLINLCGLISVEQLVLLLQRSSLFIGNDSGPLHLAAAARIATVSFFGPETPAVYGPRGDAHAVLYKNIPCSPCLNVYNSKDNTSCRNNVCMQSIGVDEAWAAVQAKLQDLPTPWSAQAARGAR